MTAKRAVVRRRRTDPSGHRLLYVVCPHCRAPHWLPEAATGTCPRRTSARPFTITNLRTAA